MSFPSDVPSTTIVPAARRRLANRGPPPSTAQATMTLEDHRRAFTTFSASLMADFERYLAQEGADPVTDGVVYRQAAMWLTEEEFAALIDEVQAAIIARTGNEPSDDRARHVISLVVMPNNPPGQPTSAAEADG
ncbi:hypothetical protein ACWEV3_16565 [Saccharopolyspora sp. NPDC003752]